MATESLKKTELFGGYGYLLAGKKRAHKSKGLKGITIKKPKLILVSSNSSDHSPNNNIGDDDDSLKKNQIICNSGYGSIHDYSILDEISQGGYGSVHRARHNKTGKIVAIKKQFDGLTVSSEREINILKSLNHPSIVQYQQVVSNNYNRVYIVMEYLDYDLHTYMYDSVRAPLSLCRVKRLMWELLDGVKFLHRHRVMHRDLKPSNILVSSQGKLKICDFGLSRPFPCMMDPRCSPCVGTLWYKASELLVENHIYLAAVDMWSVGCIMAELFLKQVLFQGASEIGQLKLIRRVLQQPRNQLLDKFAEASKGGPVLSEVGFDLLCKLLAYDPRNRITAEDALKHAWFDEVLSSKENMKISGT